MDLLGLSGVQGRPDPEKALSGQWPCKFVRMAPFFLPKNVRTTGFGLNTANIALVKVVVLLHDKQAIYSKLYKSKSSTTKYM
jgi:hypothetical protein